MRAKSLRNKSFFFFSFGVLHFMCAHTQYENTGSFVTREIFVKILFLKKENRNFIFILDSTRYI